MPDEQSKRLIDTTKPVFETVGIDMTEHPVERPKKTGRPVFRQKKRHIVKSQIIAD